MSKIKSLSIAVVIVGALFILILQLNKNADASVVVGNDYKSYLVDSTVASTTPVIVKVGQGSLGSIIIASSTTSSIFAVYDHTYATSSVATSTKIVTFPVSASGGTYTFDREISKGIVLHVPASFAGTYVVTYR